MESKVEDTKQEELSHTNEKSPLDSFIKRETPRVDSIEMKAEPRISIPRSHPISREKTPTDLDSGFSITKWEIDQQKQREIEKQQLKEEMENRERSNSWKHNETSPNQIAIEDKVIITDTFIILSL